MNMEIFWNEQGKFWESKEEREKRIVMEGLEQVKKFIQEAEKFKTTEKYQTMPSEQRDFFNEELGRFKLMVELDNSYQTGQKKNSEK